MAWFPINLTVPQYVDGNGDPYSGAVLKAYQAGTSTVTALATDYTGGTTANSIALNANGYPEVSGSIVIPHVDRDYKLRFYPTQAAADANTGALWTIDHLTGYRALLNGIRIGKVSNDTSLAALVTDIGATVTHLHLYPEAWSVPAGFTIPANITLECPRGVDIQIASGQTLTMPVPSAGPDLLFTGDGTVVFTGAGDVYPQWFGSAVDGVTLDTAAQAKAIAAAVNRNLIFTQGTHLTAGMTVNVKTHIRLNPGATIKLADATNADVLTISADEVIFEGGNVDGNRANQTGSSDTILVSGDNVEVRGVEVRDAYTYGIVCVDCNGAKIINNRIYDTGNLGILYGGPTIDRNDILIQGNLVDRVGEGAGIASGGIAVHGDNSSINIWRARVIGNTVKLPNNPSGACVGIEVWGYSPNAVVSGNTVNGSSFAYSAARADYCAITGNTAYDAKNYGIEIAESDHCAVTGNTVDGNALTTRGIVLSGTTTSNYCAISGNTIHDTVNRGIVVSAAGAYNAISGNAIRKGGAYAIELLEGSLYTAVTGNVIDGDGLTTQAVFVNEASDIAISGNVFENITHALYLFGDSAATIDNITMQGNLFKNVANQITQSLAGGAALGDSIKTWGNVGSAAAEINYTDYNNNRKHQLSSGNPEGSITAGITSVFLNTTGGAGTTFYVKETGTGNTGWAGK